MFVSVVSKVRKPILKTVIIVWCWFGGGCSNAASVPCSVNERTHSSASSAGILAGVSLSDACLIPTHTLNTVEA